MHLPRTSGLILVLLCFAAACGGEAADAGEAAEAPVEVEEFRYVRLPGGARIVSGRLHNRTDAPISNAQIRVALYDADNLLVTTMSILVQDLGPDERKFFREPVDVEGNIQGARVRGVLVM